MKIKEYKNLGETVCSGSLPNGLEVITIPRRDFRQKYAVFATCYGGACRRFRHNGVWYDTPAGVAHFLEHKLFDMPDGDNALNILSMNGAQPNAFTSGDVTAYYFECSEGFEENLRMLLRFVSTPYFTEESVAKEQGIIGQEIGMGDDDPYRCAYFSLMRMLYEHNPVREEVAGTVESIAGITADTLYTCHAAFYNPKNMVLCAAGDFDPQKIYDIAMEELGDKDGISPEVDFGEEESCFPLEKYSELNMEVSAPQFFIGAKISPIPRGEALLRQKIVSQLALRTLFGRSGNFYNSMYSDGLLNREFDFETDYVAGTGTVIFEGESREPRTVLAEIIRAVNEVREKGLDRDLFRRAKKASYGARLRGLESFDTVCLSAMDGYFEGYEPMASFDVLESVTVEECEAFLTEYLAEDRLALSVVLPLK
ncbi:MAG: insulinase family protein [Oscillospiraceae bacterium]|nr:insulinase family protein [Oscillospiraceae bacterium]